MSDPENVQYYLAALQHHVNLVKLTLHQDHEMKKKNSRKKHAQKRRYWARAWIARRHSFGLYDQLMMELRNEDQTSFKNFMRMRHLASGNKYASLKFGWRIPHNTQSILVREVCQAIVDEYMDELMVCPSTPEGWREVADKFQDRWNFPHTCGALDGKHVAIRAPPNSGSLYYNYKGFYSIVLFALVDGDYKFLWADIGGLGSASDSQIYNES